MTALRAVNSSPMRDLLFFLPFWTNVISQPSILNTSISCDKTDFLLKIRFNETFAGAILTEKGDPNCVYVNGSIQKSTDYEVKIPLTGCETRRNSDGNLENEIIIQTGDRFNPRYDKKYLLTCIPTSPIFRDSQVTVSFGGITINTELTTAISLINSPKVDYRVVVRDGDSPDAPVLNRPLAVGDRVTYTVHLGPTSRGHIGRCWASDGKSNLELSDNSGCSLQKAGDVWGDFEEIRDDSGAMFLNHIKAWAFPTRKFTVLRLSPTTKEEVEYLQNIYIKDVKLDFWKPPSEPGKEVHVMLDEDMSNKFISSIDAKNITHSVMIEDVRKVIVDQKTKREQLNSELRLKDWREGKVHFNLAQYHSFADVINYLNALAITYPERVSVQPIGTTHEGRQIPLIKITNKRSNAQKKGIWVDGGIHAREWVSPSTVLYFISQLVTQYDREPLIRQFVDQIEWFIVPLLNPDGYEYSRSSNDPEIRLWRKNRSPPKCIQQNTGIFSPPTTTCCQGVDLNRNFDWFFGQVGSSTDPCSEIYQGAYAFSEPETAAVRDFLQHHHITTFLTFHSYSQILMYPFGHQVRTYSNDLNDLRSTALSASSALQRMFGTNYKVGTGADTLYPASGGSEDWAKGKAHVKFSFLFELRPEEQVWDGFLLAENQILPTARETWEAVKVIATQTLALPVTTSRVSQRRRECVDRDALCGSWAQGGACESWPEMKQRCPRSCGLCT